MAAKRQSRCSWSPWTPHAPSSPPVLLYFPHGLSSPPRGRAGERGTGWWWGRGGHVCEVPQHCHRLCLRNHEVTIRTEEKVSAAQATWPSMSSGTRGRKRSGQLPAAEKKPAASLSPGSTAARSILGERNRDPREGAQMSEKGSEGFRPLSKLGAEGPSAAPGRPYQPQQGSSPRSSCLHKSDLAPNLLGSGGQGQRQRGSRWNPSRQRP